MKTMKNMVIALALTVAFIMLVGCGNSNSAYVGRWRHISGNVIEFNRDGTGLVNDSTNITWSTENGRLTLDGFSDGDMYLGGGGVHEWNGVHDYEIFDGYLRIWIASPWFDGDTSMLFRRLGEN